MNKARRKEISKCQDDLNAILDRLQCVLDEEQEAYDNLPEGIQMGERGDAMQ